jgi:hypothetical protein
MTSRAESTSNGGKAAAEDSPADLEDAGVPSLVKKATILPWRRSKKLLNHLPCI